jgi:hypothetical protein
VQPQHVQSCNRTFIQRYLFYVHAFCRMIFMSRSRLRFLAFSHLSWCIWNLDIRYGNRLQVTPEYSIRGGFAVTPSQEDQIYFKLQMGFYPVAVALQYNKQINSVAPWPASELYRLSDRHLSAKFSANVLRIEGCRVISSADPA